MCTLIVRGMRLHAKFEASRAEWTVACSRGVPPANV